MFLFLVGVADSLGINACGAFLTISLHYVCKIYSLSNRQSIDCVIQTHKPHPQKIKKRPKGRFFISGGSGWIRTSSGLSQQIYSLPRLSNSGARPILGAGSGNRTRISSLEGLHTSLCTMPATKSKLNDYIINEIKIKTFFTKTT